MKAILDWFVWFFSGIRFLLPLLPGFVWIAIKELYDSTVNYWKNSQAIVEKISYTYLKNAPEGLPSSYDRFVGNTCYGLASFLYLLGWLAMSWLTMEAFRLLFTTIF